MSADGTWKLTMQTPIGERKSTLALQSSGATLSGKMIADEGATTEVGDMHPIDGHRCLSRDDDKCLSTNRTMSA